MFSRQSRAQRQLHAAKTLLAELASQLNARISVQLWDGSMVPLGESVEPDMFLSISGPGVIGSIVRRPSATNLLEHYARGHIGFHGADMHTFMETLAVNDSRKRMKQIRKSVLVKSLLPFLLESSKNTRVDHEYQGDVTGKSRKSGENKDYIQFHYDVSNEFYELFLDKQMVYTCAYFTDWNNSLDQAQHDKLDMICKKLRLQQGERLLDIGFGWGSLLIHAAKHYGVIGHGITLAENQVSYTHDKIKQLGLQDHVTVELCDYQNFEGTFDKVASIGMYEHVGIDNMPGYMRKVNSFLPKHGLFLLQGITRPGKATMKQFRHLNAERKILNKYIFPGGELDHLGDMIQTMESNGFEVSDVEGWRNHYMQTCKLWCQRLYERREEAIGYVGEEKYRVWLLYLAGCSMAFKNGGARLYQVLMEKQAKREPSVLPLTRADLYHGDAAKRRFAA